MNKIRLGKNVECSGNRVNKVYCGECVCWQEKRANMGTCRRRSAHTSDMAASYWPETGPDQFCYEGIKKGEEKPQEPQLIVEQNSNTNISDEEIERMVADAKGGAV